MKAIDEAKGLIYNDRNDQYGSIEEEARKLAQGWSVILGCDVPPEKTLLCMAWLKIVRQAHKHKKDNVVDLIGYAQLLDDLMDSEEEDNCCHKCVNWVTPTALCFVCDDDFSNFEEAKANANI